MPEKLSPGILISAYCSGFFPMAESRYGEIYWYSPDPRAIIPLENIKQPRSIRKSIRRGNFEFKIDEDFGSVIRGCSNRNDTWISEEIIAAYCNLHKLGFAHSVETYSSGRLIGGLYGVAIGGAFFGESMYSEVSDASKAAFYHLAERLKEKGFVLLDTQFLIPFTESLGAIEIPREKYLEFLKKAIALPLNLFCQ